MLNLTKRKLPFLTLQTKRMSEQVAVVILCMAFFFWLTFAHSSLLDFINAAVSCFEPIVRNNNKK